MASSRCILIRKPVLPWIAIVLMLLVFSTSSGHGVLSISVTSLLLIFFSILLTFPKQNPVIFDQEPVQEQENVTSHRTALQEEKALSTENQCLPPVTEKAVPEKELTSVESQHGVTQVHGFMVRSPVDLYSESESTDRSSSSEDSDIEWLYSGKSGPTPECSDDSISDEESLFEIALPSGHCFDPKQDPKSLRCLHHKFPDFPSEKLLLAEINEGNEEENLIEIDLSMGSIKYSTSEIEA